MAKSFQETYQKRRLLTGYFSVIVSISFAQQNDKSIIDNIYKNALTSDIAYNQLEVLCKEAPGRLIGTPNSLS